MRDVSWLMMASLVLAGCGGSDGSSVDAAAPDADPSAPTCTITAPLDATTVDFDQEVMFAASASDPEDGPLTGTSVVWTSSLALASLGTGPSLTISQLPVPGVQTVTCTATDSTARVGRASIQITSRSPVAALSHPGDGEVRPANQDIPFVGDGRDFEDGVLPDGGLTWTSSLDGPIGTGRTFQRMLSAGSNVITLTATDSAGNASSTSITLTITP